MPQAQQPAWWREIASQLGHALELRTLIFSSYFDRTENSAAFATLVETMTGLMMN
jgi:hypothetical protein